MSFGKKRPILRNTEQLTLAVARNMTVDELAKIGRYNLRVLLLEAGVARDSDEFVNFMTMMSHDQAEYLHELIQPTALEKLAIEMNDALDEHSRWRKTCRDLAKVMKGMRR